MAPAATSSAAPTIPNQDRRGSDDPSWLPIPVITCSWGRWFTIDDNGTDAPHEAWVRARTDAGTPIPARRSGAGCGSPYWTPKGTTPAQVLPVSRSVAPGGQGTGVFSDQGCI